MTLMPVAAVGLQDGMSAGMTVTILGTIAGIEAMHTQTKLWVCFYKGEKNVGIYRIDFPHPVRG